MTIALEDLHPGIAETFRDRVRALLEKNPEEHTLTGLERQARGALDQAHSPGSPQRVGKRPAALAVLSVVGMYLFLYLSSSFFFFAMPFVLTLGLCFLEGTAARQATTLQKRYPPAAFRAVLPLLPQTRAESSYYEALLSLYDGPTALDEATRRDILRQMNALLENRFHLDVQRRRILDLLDGDVIARLEAERDALEQRIEQTADPITWETLRQGAELCQARLENARALVPMLGRLEAQGEVIHQALSAVHFAVARLRVAPLALTPAVSEIKETVSRINNQTQAMEQAVAEVVALRAH
jgi:hypothetical protein